MSGVTSKQRLPYPTSSDRVSEYPTLARQLADRLDSILQELETTPWEPLPLATGWSAVNGHTPRIRKLGGTVCIEGAVMRNAGGFLDKIVTIPKKYLPSSGTQFVGSSTARKSSGAFTFAPSELYISCEKGYLGINDYTGVDSGAGWILPLSCTYAPRA
ncbi:hypothetical protein [Schaalia sp. ZJ1691]|uniref:hypothetical protein n=1 Tax=Schaalia sp. ZJ1691 TaxID=2709404 RepID=UPI0013EC770D|nr:hypothetical protein [Schaalia sp. ZJ1691]